MLKHMQTSSQKPSRLVVLGAGGFIGGAVARHCGSSGIPVLGLGREQLDLMAADAAEKLAALLHADDTLVFVSAKAPVRNLAMLRDNLLMADAVCGALKKVSVSHLVYISSDAVYKDSTEPLIESSCAEPGSLHGAMHLTREIALRSDFAGPFAVVRPTLVYGLDDPHNGYGPNRFRRLAAEGKEIVLFGEGEERRDHVAVTDVAELVRLIVMHKSVGIVNAVSGEVVSFRQLAEYAASEFQPKVRVVGSPRSGAMPHNGYRPFTDAAVRQAFPGFHFRSWRDGLAAVHAEMKVQLTR
jgi:nucleoside-diphosphate-sugar epimerase